ncbi:MAG: DUF2726 domain-containing protein [Pseudomonadota bacterium]
MLKSLNNLLFILLGGLVLLGVIAAALKSPDRRGKGERPKARAPVTLNEQGMYNRLIQTLPDLVVLSQVSFGALLTANARAVRNTFDRKIADFVVCTKAFEVLAVVELDDSSHRGNEAKDAKRDALLKAAGYRVLRYSRIPDVDRVRQDFAPPAVASERLNGQAERGA